MEIQNLSPATSPTSSTNSNGFSGSGKPPKSVSKPDPNTYPSTFIQADATNFKQLVQMLTGSSESSNTTRNPSPSKTSIPPIKSGQGFKLHERRKTLKNGLKIDPSGAGFGFGSSPRHREVFSPSVLDFPALVLSPITPLIGGAFDKSAPAEGLEEERVVGEKGFYLTAAAATPRGTAEPRLLALFPVPSSS